MVPVNPAFVFLSALLLLSCAQSVMSDEGTSGSAVDVSADAPPRLALDMGAPPAGMVAPSDPVTSTDDGPVPNSGTDADQSPSRADPSTENMNEQEAEENSPGEQGAENGQPASDEGAEAQNSADDGMGSEQGSPPAPADEPDEPEPQNEPPPVSPPRGDPVPCNDTCVHANDGMCDDGAAGATTTSCTEGTDCSDCGPRGQGIPGCTDDCQYAGDNRCDDGGDSQFNQRACPYGTDCSDCGIRDPNNPPSWLTQPEGGGCTDTCPARTGDGLCDDGGPRSHSAQCPLGTDCSDCGPR